MRRAGTRRQRHKVQAMVASDTIRLLKNPITRLVGVTYSCRNGVLIAPSHSVFRPASISQA